MATEQEKIVLRDLASAWDGFLKLQEQHPCDRDEFRRAIHAAQNIIGCRVAQRVDPDTFRMYSKKIE